MPPRAGTRLRTKLRGRQTRRERLPGTGLPAEKQGRSGGLRLPEDREHPPVSLACLPLKAGTFAPLGAGPGWGALPPPGCPGHVPAGQPPQDIGTCVPGLADSSFSCS